LTLKDVLAQSLTPLQSTYTDALEAGESMEVVWIVRKLENFGDDVLLTPVNAKLLYQQLQAVHRSLTDGIHFKENRSNNNEI